MKALIQVRPDTEIVMDEMFANAARAMSTGEPSDPVAVITFSSPSQLFTVFSPKRWELVEHLQKIGPVSIRGLARSLGRDVKRVHEDVTTLIEWSIVEHSEDGRIYVPFEVIHAGFDLRVGLEKASTISIPCKPSGEHADVSDGDPGFC